MAPAQSVEAERDGRLSYVEPVFQLACRANGHNENRPSCFPREEAPVVGTIYVLRNKVNGKCYVGQTLNLSQRLTHHQAKSAKLVISSAIKKYGWDHFELLSWDIPASWLDDMEQAMIARLDSLSPKGYNRDSGGTNGKQRHPETRRQLSRALTGRFIPETARRNMSLAHKGQPNNQLGLKRSVVSRRRMSIAALNRPRRVYTRPMPPRHMTPVVCLETGEIFRMMKDAAAKYSAPAIGPCCRGEWKTSGGYHWAFYKEAAKESA